MSTWCINSVKQWRKGNLWNKWCQVNCTTIWEQKSDCYLTSYSVISMHKNQTGPHLEPYAKINWKNCFKGFFCLLPLLFGLFSIWEILLYRCLGSQHTLTLDKKFLKTQKPIVITRKTELFCNIKFNNFYLLKTKSAKTQVQEGCLWYK